MFSNRNNRPDSTPNNRYHDQDTIPASWGDFSRKLYFYRDVNREDAANTARRNSIKKMWIYFGIAITYLILIGIVVAVLIIAPKYPSFYYSSYGHQVPPYQEYIPPPLPPLPIPSEGYNDPNLLLEGVENPVADLTRLTEGIGPDLSSLPFPNEQELFQLEHPLQVIQPFRPSPKDDVLIYDLIEPRSGIITETERGIQETVTDNTFSEVTPEGTEGV